MSSSSSISGDSATTVPLQTLLHLIPIKLVSTNYLPWKNQITPVLSFQNLIGFIDGRYPSPAETINTDGKNCANPAYITWKESNQKVLLIIQATLSKEAMSEIIGLTTARQVWLALENAYSQHSLERMHTLNDILRQMKKGSSTVSEYGCKFKLICDQLAAIGYLVKEHDKTHWFLCGLGSAFETFSTTHRALPSSSFRDLLSKAENHELFLQAINVPTAPQAAFVAHQCRTNNSFRNFQGSFSNRGRSRGSGRGRGRGCGPPNCQLCKKDGHSATSYPSLSSFAQRAPTIDANLA
ncbi:uncharacterized protein LOC143558406 [Bidens hawaiensis]|uniref:uncharacterized protein LOC143558406 n=1 Tax=Bidens hawaiensis TaxID=980011 RepID=UPI00404AE8DA